MALTLITNQEKSSALSRRTFLQGISAVVGASALGGIGSGLFDPQAALAALGPTLPTGTPVLVMIELQGGNDILNTIIPMSVPFTTGHYRTARPTLGITRLNTTLPFAGPPAGDPLPPALDLKNGWAMHGSLSWLANRWHYFKDVAIIQGTGENVKHEMSHFASFAFHWAGAFTGPLLNTGWMGRYNDLANPSQPLGAVSLIGAHDSLTSVNSPSVAIQDLANFAFNVGNIPDSSAWLAQLQAMGDVAPTATNKAATSSRAIYDSHQAMATAQGITAFPAGGSGGSLAQQLSVVASLINAGVPCQTYVTGIGGFDNHGGEPASHTSQLLRLNAGLSNFFNLLNSTTRSHDVIVCIYSEFSRQIKQNASTGTDHGLASSTIVIGNGIQGGFYGQHPSLDPVNRYNDSMVATVDFRSVYATLLNRLGGDPALTETALGRDESNVSFPDLGLWTTGPVAGSGADAPLDTSSASTPADAPTTAAPVPTTVPPTTAPATSVPSTTIPSTTAPSTVPSTVASAPTTSTTAPLALKV